jgi:hypothetical protein
LRFNISNDLKITTNFSDIGQEWLAPSWLLGGDIPGRSYSLTRDHVLQLAQEELKARINQIVVIS